MIGTAKLSVLLAFIFFIWALGRSPPGKARHAINRLSIIGAFVSIGMWLGCLAIEVSGYLLPFEGWISFFFGWLFIFCLIYSRTRPPPVNPPAPNPDSPEQDQPAAR